MKSVIEEASTVFKAIEKGWLKAGQPKEFTVKIFEKPSKNFFGITTKSAKIGIFFKEYSVEVPEKKIRELKVKKEEKPLEIQEKREPRKFWTPEMVDIIQEWLQNVLKKLNKEQVLFTTDHKRFYLKIHFQNPLFDDKNKEQDLFKSMAHLSMQSLRNRLKKRLSGFKVIFTSSPNKK